MKGNGPVPPVIVIGMHRSGTSLVTRMLEDLGVFVGTRKDENEEAQFFVELNRWLIRQSGGAWDQPEAVRWLLDDAELRSLALEYMRRMLNSPRTLLFLGIRRYIRYRGLRDVREPWGWKDPRSTWTLPLWLELFPGAKVLHVARNGVDVAQSLLRRRRARLPSALARYRRFRAFYWVHPKKGGVTESVRCGSLEGGFSLWESYTTEARRAIAMVGDDGLEIRFEDLVADPVCSLARMAAFCGVHPTPDAMERVAAQIRASRAFGYRSDAELMQFASREKARLHQLGYEP